MPDLDSISRLLDSSATLGMTWRRDGGYARNDIMGDGGSATVIPAYAGIQKCLIGSMPVFGNTTLDSRLRGNDGKGGLE